MKVRQAIVAILKLEQVEILTRYLVNPIIEQAAVSGIRPVVVRQKRIGLHLADAISRWTGVRTISVFAAQHGPGTENSYGGIAQAFPESVPTVLPAGHPRRLAFIDPNYDAVR